MAKTSGTGIGKVLDDEDNGSRHELSSTGARTMLRSNTALALRGKDRCPMCKSKTAVLNMQHVWTECGACIDATKRNEVAQALEQVRDLVPKRDEAAGHDRAFDAALHTAISTLKQGAGGSMATAAAADKAESWAITAGVMSGVMPRPGPKAMDAVKRLDLTEKAANEGEQSGQNEQQDGASSSGEAAKEKEKEKKKKKKKESDDDEPWQAKLAGKVAGKLNVVAKLVAAATNE